MVSCTMSMKTMKDWEEKLDGKLMTLPTSINFNTNKRLETIVEVQTTSIRTLVSFMVLKFQRSNQRMEGIINNFATSLLHFTNNSHEAQTPPTYRLELVHIFKHLRVSYKNCIPLTTSNKTKKSLMNSSYLG